ncbi:hypothetical protein KGQ64_11835 [bacterium]|nr:hypothetical protein [bacterium]
MRQRLAVLLLLLIPGLLGMRGFNQQIQLRVEGFLDADPGQVRPWANLEVNVGSARNTHRFMLTDIVSLSVGGPMGSDILEQVMPLHPNFIWNGDQALLDQISAAKPNQYVKIVGYLAFSPQSLLIQTVEISEPITGPTPTPSLRKEILGF